MGKTALKSGIKGTRVAQPGSQQLLTRVGDRVWWVRWLTELMADFMGLMADMISDRVDGEWCWPILMDWRTWWKLMCQADGRSDRLMATWCLMDASSLADKWEHLEMTRGDSWMKESFGPSGLGPTVWASEMDSLYQKCHFLHLSSKSTLFFFFLSFLMQKYNINSYKIK